MSKYKIKNITGVSYDYVIQTYDTWNEKNIVRKWQKWYMIF